MKEVSDVVNRFRELNFQFPSVRADSQIATALAVRELILVAMLNDAVHFSSVATCIYKTRTNEMARRLVSILSFDRYFLVRASDWNNQKRRRRCQCCDVSLAGRDIPVNVFER